MIEIEVPTYHPKDCSCVVCKACEAVLDEITTLRARVNALLEERVLIQSMHRTEVERLQHGWDEQIRTDAIARAALRAALERKL